MNPRGERGRFVKSESEAAEIFAVTAEGVRQTETTEEAARLVHGPLTHFYDFDKCETVCGISDHDVEPANLETDDITKVTCRTCYTIVDNLIAKSTRPIGNWHGLNSSK